MLTAQELQEGLAQFNCTDAYHQTGPLSPRILISDGVQYLAENAGAYWLIDAICSYQHKLLKNERLREFQMWKLTVDLKASTAVLVGHDDDVPVVRQEIPYTDFPLSEIVLWIEPTDANFFLILLPSEH